VRSAELDFNDLGYLRLEDSTELLKGRCLSCQRTPTTATKGKIGMTWVALWLKGSYMDW
jgi:hypothetical protein